MMVLHLHAEYMPFCFSLAKKVLYIRKLLITMEMSAILHASDNNAQAPSMGIAVVKLHAVSFSNQDRVFLCKSSGGFAVFRNGKKA